jgi:hypothetical protein
VGLDALQSVDSLEILDSAALEAIALPALQTAISIFATHNPVAQHLTMPALVVSQSLTVTDNAQLPSCEVLALRPSVAGPIVQSGNDDTKVCTPGGGGTLVR